MTLPPIEDVLREARKKAAEAPPGVRIYCEQCCKHQPFTIDALATDELNPAAPWGDIVCMACHFVIATISAPDPGTYAITRTGD